MTWPTISSTTYRVLIDVRFGWKPAAKIASGNAPPTGPQMVSYARRDGKYHDRIWLCAPNGVEPPARESGKRSAVHGNQKVVHSSSRGVALAASAAARGLPTGFALATAAAGAGAGAGAAAAFTGTGSFGSARDDAGADCAAALTSRAAAVCVVAVTLRAASTAELCEPPSVPLKRNALTVSRKRPA